MEDNVLEIDREEKIVEKKEERKKRKKSKYFDLYISKALKQVSSGEITNNAKQQLNNLLIIISKLITEKALHLVEISKKRTLSVKELQNAINILFIGDLKNVLIEEGEKSTQRLKESKEEEKKGYSRQSRVGIIFPPSVCEKFLRKFGNSNVMITSESPIYLAAMIEYISAEILDLSSSISACNNRVRITVRDLELAVRTDYEFNNFFSKYNISFIGGGIVPFINPVLLDQKVTKGKKIINDIKKLQKQGDCLIFAKYPFEQVIRYLINQYKTDVKISKNVILILQYYIESEMLNLIQKAYNLAVYAGRIKLIASDLEMVLSIQEDRLPNFLEVEDVFY